MTDLRKASEIALIALEYHTMQTRPIYHTNKAIEALRQALAQPEQEPVAWYSHNPDYPIQDGDWVEVIFTSGQPDDAKKWTPLYTAPQNPDVTLTDEGKTWQGLTDEQISLMAHNDDDGDWNDLKFRDIWHSGYLAGFRSAEAKLKEKL